MDGIVLYEARSGNWTNEGVEKGAAATGERGRETVSVCLDLFAFIDQVEYDSVTIRFMVTKSQQ